jgi:hypothetical protein
VDKEEIIIWLNREEVMSLLILDLLKKMSFLKLTMDQVK